MHTVSVTRSVAGGIQIHFPRKGEESATAEAHSEVALDPGPSPIAPEKKELAWGLGSFLVLFLLMRFFLFPKVKRGMDARYGKIRGDHENAASVKAEATAEVAAYQATLVQIRASAAEVVEAARQQIEVERTELLRGANSRIADKRAVAATKAAAERSASRESLEVAVADVTALVAELSVGHAPDAASVREAVAAAIGGGA